MKRLTVLLAALGALLLVSAAPALASEELEFKETFGSAEQPSFSQASRMAVDQSSGELYVLDGAANTLYRFNADGTPSEFPILGSNEIAVEAGGTSSVAIDESGGATDGDIYVMEEESSPVRVGIYSEEGLPLGELTESSSGAYFGLLGMTVDGSGNVYVSDLYGTHKYEPSANPVENSDNSTSFGPAGTQMAAGRGPSAGALFGKFENVFGGENFNYAKMNSSSGAIEYEIDAETSTASSVDPVTGYLYQATSKVAGHKVNVWDASGGSLVEVGSTTLAEAAEGVAVNGSTGDVYVSHAGNTVEVYELVAGASEQPLTLKINEGEGTVISNPAGITCTGSSGKECTSEFEEGAEVTLTASPAAGYRFNAWGSCPGPNGRQCTVTMSEAKEVGAFFDRSAS